MSSAETPGPLRILHVVTVAGPDPALGGPLRVALDQAHELVNRGCDVRLLAGWDERRQGPTSLEGIPATLVPVRVLTSRFAMTSRLSLAIARQLATHVRQADIVHVHLGRHAIPLLASLVSARSGTPYVVQTHGMIAPDDRGVVAVVDGLATRRALSKAARRLVLTDSEAGDIRAIVDEPTTLLRNGIPVGDPVRPTHGSDAPEVLFFGRIHPNKQPLLFAEAARVLHLEGRPARFVIIGPDHGELDALLRFIDEHDTRDYLVYDGVTPISESRKRLGQADLFVQPTLSEPFGLSALQAMAEGVPSIVSTGFVIAPEISAAQGALVVEPTLTGVTDGIRRLLDDPVERSALAVRGHDMVRTQFSMRVVVDQLQAIYREVLRGL